MKKIIQVVYLLIGLHFSGTGIAKETVDTKSPLVQFAYNEIKTALAARGEHVSISIAIDATSDLQAEGFSIVKGDQGFKVIG
jgi:uncharacterized protein YxeA